MPRVIIPPIGDDPLGNVTFEKVPNKLVQFFGKTIFDATKNAARKNDLKTDPKKYFSAQAVAAGLSPSLLAAVDNILAQIATIQVHEDVEQAAGAGHPRIKILNIVLPAATNPDVHPTPGDGLPGGGGGGGGGVSSTGAANQPPPGTPGSTPPGSTPDQAYLNYLGSLGFVTIMSCR